MRLFAIVGVLGFLGRLRAMSTVCEPKYKSLTNKLREITGKRKSEQDTSISMIYIYISMESISFH